MLFENDPLEKIDLGLPDATVYYYPNFISPGRATTIFKTLLKETDWQQDDITVFGKTYPQPRLTALFGENANPYTYSNITMHPVSFPKILIPLKNKVEQITGKKFTTCLANLYRNGQDSNGWHADNEKELGAEPVIASVSFGAGRNFHLKHRTRKDLKRKVELTHGSLLIMQGKTQTHWLHQISKTKKLVSERINLTFRVIK